MFGDVDLGGFCSLHLENVEPLRESRTRRVGGGDGEIPIRAQDVGRHRRPLVQRLRHIRAHQGIVRHAGQPVARVERQIRPRQADADEGRLH